MSGRRIQDLTGQTFGRLLVLSLAGKMGTRKLKWHCLCACGTTVAVAGEKIRSGSTKSCGCFQLESRRRHDVKVSVSTGLLARTFTSWRAMVNRCYRKSWPSYPRYGGRGITVQDSWRSFPLFLADMGSRPDGTSLDRIDSNGNYAPGNCRWATAREQARNRTNNKLTMDAAREIRSRLANGALVGEVSRQYEVSRATIREIRSGEIWAE